MTSNPGSAAGVQDPERSAGDPPAPPRRPGPGPVLFAGLGVAILLAGAFAYLAVRHRDQQNQLSNIRATGIPSSVSTSVADLMALSPVQTRPAPGFRLVDQQGRTLPLSSFKGNAVVLEFMDPHCVDICPIVSQEFVDAYHDLGSAASHVVFLAVNVNRYHLKVAEVAAFSRAHQLTTIPTWHFFTGSANDLQAVWHRYGIEVEAPSPNADIIHSSIVYFIDAQGRERYIASPAADHTAKGAAFLPAGQIASWGHGIASVARYVS